MPPLLLLTSLVRGETSERVKLPELQERLPQPFGQDSELIETYTNSEASMSFVEQAKAIGEFLGCSGIDTPKLSKRDKRLGQAAIEQYPTYMRYMCVPTQIIGKSERDRILAGSVIKRVALDDAALDNIDLNPHTIQGLNTLKPPTTTTSDGRSFYNLLIDIRRNILPAQISPEEVEQYSPIPLKENLETRPLPPFNAVFVLNALLKQNPEVDITSDLAMSIHSTGQRSGVLYTVRGDSDTTLYVGTFDPLSSSKLYSARRRIIPFDPSSV